MNKYAIACYVKHCARKVNGTVMAEWVTCWSLAWLLFPNAENTYFLVGSSLLPLHVVASVILCLCLCEQMCKCTLGWFVFRKKINITFTNIFNVLLLLQIINYNLYYRELFVRLNSNAYAVFKTCTNNNTQIKRKTYQNSKYLLWWKNEKY